MIKNCGKGEKHTVVTHTGPHTVSYHLTIIVQLYII